MKYRNHVCPEDSQNTISGILLIKQVDKINSRLHLKFYQELAIT